jgi:hypothetical protein
MSLINEALKRAEAEKRGQECPPPAPPTAAAISPTAVAVPARTSIGTKEPQPAERLTPAVKGSGNNARVVPWALSAFVLVLAAIVAGRALMYATSQTPQHAAAMNYAPPTSAPANRAEHSAAVGQTPAVLAIPLPAIVATQPSPAVTTTSAPADVPTPIPSTRPATAPASSPAATVAPPMPTSTPAVTEIPATTPASIAPAAEIPAVREPLKVSGIMRGSDGWSAIINGQIVQVGDSIDDAKVVKITAKNVVIEENGKRLTLGL